MLNVYCDGLCEPVNPGGTATFGFVVLRDGEQLHQECGVVAKGPGATNNLAEYTAVIRALEWIGATDHDGESVAVRSDSQLAVYQLGGAWAVHAPSIQPLWQQVRALVTQLGHVSFAWVPREQNVVADALSREAYKTATGAYPPGRTKDRTPGRRPVRP